MIRSVVLRNFQSHKNTKLEFVPGVNYIVGTSDSGKTAIIRALRWVYKNRPSGDAFRSNWGGSTEVIVKTDEGVVIRRRTDTKNEYEVDGVVLKALRTDVPEEVGNVLNLQDINFQNQFDKSFLLSSTSGAVAEHFSKVANFEKIGKAVRALTSKYQKHVRFLESKKSRITELRELLKGFDYIPEMEKAVVLLETKIRRFKEKKAGVDALVQLTMKIPQIEEKVRKIECLVVLEKDVEDIDKKYAIQETLRAKIHSLFRLHNRLIGIEEKLNKIQKILNLETSVNAIVADLEKQKRVKEFVRNLERLIDNSKAYEMEINQQRKSISLLEKEYSDNFPEVCPLCGNITKKMEAE